MMCIRYVSSAAWGGFSATGAGGAVSSALYGAECWLQRTQSGHTKLSGGYQRQNSNFYTVPNAHHFQLQPSVLMEEFECKVRYR